MFVFIGLGQREREGTLSRVRGCLIPVTNRGNKRYYGK